MKDNSFSIHAGSYCHCRNLSIMGLGGSLPVGTGTEFTEKEFENF